MAGMAFQRVRSPEEDQVRPVFDLAQRTGGFSDLLECHDRWSMAERGGRIDVCPDPVSQGDSCPLAVGTASGQSIEEGCARRPKNGLRPGHRFFQRHRLAFDLSDRRLTTFLVQEPGFGQMTGPLGPGDPLVLHRDAQIVTNTTADRASHIVDHPNSLFCHRQSLRFPTLREVRFVNKGCNSSGSTGLTR